MKKNRDKGDNDIENENSKQLKTPRMWPGSDTLYVISQYVATRELFTLLLVDTHTKLELSELANNRHLGDHERLNKDKFCKYYPVPFNLRKYQNSMLYLVKDYRGEMDDLMMFHIHWGNTMMYFARRYRLNLETTKTIDTPAFNDGNEWTEPQPWNNEIADAIFKLISEGYSLLTYDEFGERMHD